MSLLWTSPSGKCSKECWTWKRRRRILRSCCPGRKHWDVRMTNGSLRAEGTGLIELVAFRQPKESNLRHTKYLTHATRNGPFSLRKDRVLCYAYDVLRGVGDPGAKPHRISIATFSVESTAFAAPPRGCRSRSWRIAHLCRRRRRAKRRHRQLMCGLNGQDRAHSPGYFTTPNCQRVNALRASPLHPAQPENALVTGERRFQWKP